MKSIKTKIMVFMLAGTLLTAIVVGGVSIIKTGEMMEADAAHVMNLISVDKAREMEALLSRIEQSVRTVSDYASGQLSDVERFQRDSGYVDDYTARIEPVLLNAANHTEGALAVYIRYNPEYTEPTSGLFCSRDSASDPFKKLTPTDFSMYDAKDAEHVGWYYLPVSNGKPTWMAPYLNKNIDVEMISYVIPLRVGEETVGVVGMDIDFGVLKRITDGAVICRTGYAFLADGQANVIYHRNYIRGTPLGDLDPGLHNLAAKLANGGDGDLVSYSLETQDKQAMFRSLRNGIKFVLTVPVEEIYEARNSMALQLILETLAVTAVMLGLTLLMARRMSAPLCELNEAAKRIAGGNLDVSITYHSDDEIGTLAESLRKTVEQLNHYINYIKGLAYRDPMTGVKSKTAYLEAVEKLDATIKISQPEFGVAVFDLNGLKTVNDKYGHDFGDMLILAASQIICKAFKHSPVYRIGGDEFAAILEKSDLERYTDLLDAFQTAMDEYNEHTKPELRVIIAKGIAIFNPATDFAYQDVFKRADSAMYHNKARMKEASGNTMKTL